MDIIQKLIPESKYSLKCPNPMTPKFLVVHNTANDASASAEIQYMSTNSSSTSFHFAVDDTCVIQGIPMDRNAWHAGDGGNGNGNRNGIGIEICYSLSGGPKFIQAEKNAAKLIAQLLKQYGWGMDKVTKHQDYSGKYCPHRTLDMGWDRFLAMCKAELDALNTPVPTPAIVPVASTVSPWAAAAQKFVLTNKISDGTRPKDAVTREELWTMLYNYHNSFGK